MGFFRRCWGFVIPLLLLIVAAPILLLIGVNTALISVITNLGTAVVMLGAVLYTVFIDSRRRWPRVPTFTRFARIVTFDRSTDRPPV